MDSTLYSSDDEVRAESILDSASEGRVRRELSRLCADSLFVRSPAAARLLSFLVEEDLAGRSGDLKESTIGNGLYGRLPTYDTKEDAVVRVNANRLRLRLDEYYSTRPDPDVRIAINRGSYVPNYRFAPEAIPDVRLPDTTIDGSSPSGEIPWNRPSPALAARSTWLRRFVWWWIPGAVSLGLFLLLMASVLGHRRLAHTESEASWSVRPLTRLAGSQNFASFSPGGTSLAFVWLPADGSSSKIYLQSLSSASPKPLVTGAGNYSRPAWSPDGKRLAYVQTQQSEGEVEVWILDTATGKTEKVISLEEPQTWLCLTPRLSWTKDGRSILTSAAYPVIPGSAGNQACGLVAIDVRSHAVRRLIEPTAGILGDVEAAISPSGESVGFIRTFSFMRSDLFLVSLHGGTPRRITFDQGDLLGFAWNPSGKALYAASRRGDGVLRLWQMGLDGTLQQLTDGSATAAFPAVSKDGRRIVFTNYRNVINLFVRRDGKTKEIIADSSENSDAQLSPDGKQLLYSSDRSGSAELWVSDVDGMNQRRIADAGIVSGHYASWSSDGSWIAFECRTKALTGICALREKGGPVLHLTDGRFNCLLPSWAHDGQSVYYTAKIAGMYQIYRQPLDGSTPFQITRQGGIRAIESVDGRSVFVHRGPVMPGLVRIPTAGTAAEKDKAEASLFFDMPGRSDWSDWTISRDAIFYFQRRQESHADRLYRYDLTTQQGSPMLTVKSLPVQSGRILSASQDGLLLVLEEAAYSAQLDLMEQHSRIVPESR